MMLPLVATIPYIKIEFGIVISLSSCVNVCKLMNCIYHAQYLSIGHNNNVYYTTKSSINCVKWDGTEVFSYKMPNEESHRKIAIDRNGNVFIYVFVFVLYIASFNFKQVKC
jgi:uncharacterized membrane protein